MSYVFGIDLETTYSCISYIDEYGKATVLKNSDGDLTTPSVVMVESESNIVVGMEAKRSLEVEPDKTVQFIKRKMGKEKDTVVLNGTTYHAPEISSMILKKLVKDANDELKQVGVIKDGEEIKDVVITCPAYFGVNERHATKTAGELAGLNVLNIINEPTAAAISYGVSGGDKKETVLVYDLGGGTFDITVMDINKGNISVVCTGGDDQLGGKDWDECLMDYVCERYEAEYGEDLTEDPETISALYVDVETWKKALTAREKVNISVNGPAGRLREELTREKYDELTEGLLNRTKNLLDSSLIAAKEKGCLLSNIDKFLLVGGSSKMPQVANMIQRDYGITAVLSDPDEAVAKGAAIYASNEKAFNDFVEQEAAKVGKTAEELKEENIGNKVLEQKYLMSGNSGSRDVMINITNVLSRTYGIAVLHGNELVIENMLMINDKLPASKFDTYGTSVDNQDGLSLKLFESRSTERVMKIEDRKPITDFKMSFTRAVPKGTAVNVTLSLDNSGTIHVVAEEMLYHSKLDTTFKLSNQMSDTELSEAVQRMSTANIE